MSKNKTHLLSTISLSITLHIVVVSVLYINISRDKVDKNDIESVSKTINGDIYQVDKKSFQNDVLEGKNHSIVSEVKIDDSKNKSNEIVMRGQLSKIGSTVTSSSDNISMFASTKQTFKLEENEFLYDNSVLLNENHARKENKADSKNDVYYTDQDLVKADEIIKIGSQNLSKSETKENDAQLNIALDEIKSINQQSLEQKREKAISHPTAEVNFINK